MGRFEFWQIAYRKKEEKTLLKDTARPFTTIANTWRFWCADPHLFEHEGSTYVFAELYDRILRRGVIGHCKITEKGCTPWRIVLRQPWHLSYPHVFSDGFKIYMIPESYVGREIALYEAVDFPDKWEKTYVLKSDYVAVDSTPFEFRGEKQMLTLHFDDGHEKLELFIIDNLHLKGSPCCIDSDNANKRPAGKFFEFHGKLIRPAQDCSESYGCALNFYEVDQADRDCFTEHLIKKVTPADIVSDFKHKAAGIHTYNQSEHFEIIDLKYYKTDLWAYIMRPIWFIYRRIKRE